jgi:hypothetical protein
LIAYRPLPGSSPWAETGPVFVHAAECEGYPSDGGLPTALRTGPRVLRGYHPDGSLDYDHIAFVATGDDVEPAIDELLGQPDVDVIHVRAHLAQCFTYAVRRDG